MANRPAQGGATGAPAHGGATGAGPDWDQARADAPPPVHHQGYPSDPEDRRHPVLAGLAWLPYLIVLAGAAFGLAIAWQGSRLAVRGTVLVGCALLAAALARLLLPSRYAGPLSCRGKASDVAGFAVFGAAVLVVALMLS